MEKNNDDLYGTSYPTESIKVIAESIGIPNLPDDAAKVLADDVTFKLKHIIQDAAKYMNHGNRWKLIPEDINFVLKQKNIEPLYGFHEDASSQFRFASGGGRELYFTEDKEIDLNDFLNNSSSNNSNTKLPIDVTVRAHWLAIDGVQPAIPENPAPVSKDSQKLEAVDPINKLNKPHTVTSRNPELRNQKLRNVETVQIKQLATHDLSAEQQKYYKAITEACVGSDETRRTEALQSLASDPSLYEMLPRLSTFICEGVRVNIVQNNLALLIYLMRMVKAILDNQSLFLEKYLHELIPSVTSCIVAKQLCARPDVDNHWALRDFAARLIAQICKNFNNSTNNIQTRITHIFSDHDFSQSVKLPLASLYGSLKGLSELGLEVIKTFILPRVKNIGMRIESYLEGTVVSNADKIATNHIKTLMVKVLTPILKNVRVPPDSFDDFKNEYGYFGPALHSAVLNARTQPERTVNISNLSLTPVGTTAISRSVPVSSGIIPQQTATPTRTVLINTTNRVNTPTRNPSLTPVGVTAISRSVNEPTGIIYQQTATPTRAILMNNHVSTATGNRSLTPVGATATVISRSVTEPTRVIYQQTATSTRTVLMNPTNSVSTPSGNSSLTPVGATPISRSVTEPTGMIYPQTTTPTRTVLINPTNRVITPTGNSFLTPVGANAISKSITAPTEIIYPQSAASTKTVFMNPTNRIVTPTGNSSLIHVGATPISRSGTTPTEIIYQQAAAPTGTNLMNPTNCVSTPTGDSKIVFATPRTQSSANMQPHQIFYTQKTYRRDET